MSPDTPLFGRLTIGANRVSLGRGGTTLLLIRIAEQLRKLRPSEDAVIQIELSRNSLPDSSTFDKLARAEQQFGERIITDENAPSPFPNITVGRVAQAMASIEYESFYEIASDPEKRMGLSQFDLEAIRSNYELAYPDCAPHFPKWVD